MIWLTPLAWLGAGLVVLPVLVHLLSRRRPRVEPAPTLRFLAPTSPLSVRRARLQDPGLLALRVLAILAAVAALARPSVEPEAPLGEGSTERTRVALVGGFLGGSSDAEALLQEARATAAAWVDGGEVHEVEAAGGLAMWHAVKAAVAHLDALPERHELLVLSDFRWGQLPAPGARTLPPGTTRVELRRIGPLPSADGAGVRREAMIGLFGGEDPERVTGGVHVEIAADAAPAPLEGGVSASWQRVVTAEGSGRTALPPEPGDSAMASPEILGAAGVLGLPATLAHPDDENAASAIEARRTRRLPLALARDPELQFLLRAERRERLRRGESVEAAPDLTGLTGLATLAVQGQVDQGLPWTLDALDPRWHTAEELEVWSRRDPGGEPGEVEPEPDDGRREARGLWLLVLLLLGAEWGLRRSRDRATVHSSSEGGPGS